MSTEKPSDQLLRDVFNRAADEIANQTYQGWYAQQLEAHPNEEVDDTQWEMSREWVADYLADYGGSQGYLVADWVQENPETWQTMCDEAGVPQSWVA